MWGFVYELSVVPLSLHAAFDPPGYTIVWLSCFPAASTPSASSASTVSTTLSVPWGQQRGNGRMSDESRRYSGPPIFRRNESSFAIHLDRKMVDQTEPLMAQGTQLLLRTAKDE